MKNILCCLSCTVMISFISCKTEVTERTDYKKVMEVHDIAMARMGEIHDMKKQIRAWKENAQDSILIKESLDLISKLEMADEGMMSWMAEFKIPGSGPEDELKNFFASEQVKVDRVSVDINAAINSASEFLEKHKPEE
jgi:hypothetical protein